MEETKTYELGFLLTPLLTEEGAVAFLSGEFKQLLEQNSAVTTVAATAKMIPLAYVIRKRIDNKNQIFREAYLCALRFTAAPETIPALIVGLKKMNQIIRSLIVIIPKGAEIVVPPRHSAVSAKPADEITTKGQVGAVETEVAPINGAEVIDKEIDNLLASTAQ